MCEWPSRSNFGYSCIVRIEIRARWGCEVATAAREGKEPNLPGTTHAGQSLPSVRSRPQEEILDEIDRRVIKILQVDGRRPNTEIARELRVSETTIRKRVAQLVSRGLINVVAVPTPRAVGMNLSAIIGISVTLPRLRAVSDELKRLREVRYVGVSTGRYDIIVEAFFFDQQHFLEFISTTLSRMDGITGIETSMILDVVKFSYEWEIA